MRGEEESMNKEGAETGRVTAGRSHHAQCYNPGSSTSSVAEVRHLVLVSTPMIQVSILSMV